MLNHQASGCFPKFMSRYTNSSTLVYGFSVWSLSRSAFNLAEFWNAIFKLSLVLWKLPA